jgi:hypothetical protein
MEYPNGFRLAGSINLRSSKNPMNLCPIRLLELGRGTHSVRHNSVAGIALCGDPHSGGYMSSPVVLISKYTHCDPSLIAT